MSTVIISRAAAVARQHAALLLQAWRGQLTAVQRRSIVAALLLLNAPAAYRLATRGTGKQRQEPSTVAQTLKRRVLLFVPLVVAGVLAYRGSQSKAVRRVLAAWPPPPAVLLRLGPKAALAVAVPAVPLLLARLSAKTELTDSEREQVDEQFKVRTSALSEIMLRAFSEEEDRSTKLLEKLGGGRALAKLKELLGAQREKLLASCVEFVAETMEVPCPPAAAAPLPVLLPWPAPLTCLPAPCRTRRRRCGRRCARRRTCSRSSKSSAGM